MPKEGYHWNYFNKTIDDKKRINGSCIYCNTNYLSNKSRMMNHLESCNQMPQAEKEKLHRYMKSASNSNQPNKRRAEVRISDIRQEPVRNAPAIAPSHDSSQPTTSTSHLAPVTNMKQQMIKPFLEFMSTEDNSRANSLLCRWMCKKNISFNAFSDPLWKEFVGLLRPSYKTCDAQKTLGGSVLKKEYKDLKTVVEKTIDSSPFVSLCSDGFTDVASNHIANVIVATPIPMLYATIDTTGERESGEYLYKQLKQIIEQLGPEKISCLMTDHARNIRLACKLLQIDYEWILIEGCRAHLLNLLALDICKLKAFVKLIKRCTIIAKFFKNKQVPRKALAKAQVEAKLPVKKLVLPVITRWSSNYVVCLKVLKNKVALQSAIRSPTLVGVAKRKSIEELMDSDFWNNLSKIVLLLQPIAEAINIVESDSATMYESFFAVDKCFEKIETVLKSKFADKSIVRGVKKFLENRKLMADTPVADLLYSLNPNNLDNLSSADENVRMVDTEKRQRAMKLLHDRFSLNPRIGTGVIDEMAAFNARLPPFDLQSKPYAWSESMKCSLMKFWVGCFNETKLSLVVKSLNSMILSAASAERSFSLHGAVHTKSRNRLKVSKAGMQTYLKHNMALFDPKKKQAIPKKLDDEEDEDVDTESDTDTDQDSIHLSEENDFDEVSGNGSDDENDENEGAQEEAYSEDNYEDESDVENSDD